MQPSGAVLLAVMRGRSSEGVDFLDDCARAVVIVGIPYPPLYETSVRLKRSFNQDHAALLGSGDDWYAAEAFRAVNQAIGEETILLLLTWFPPAVLLLLNSTLTACLFHAYEHETAAVAELSSDAIHVLMCQIQNVL